MKLSCAEYSAEGKSRNIKENRGTTIAKQEGGEGILDASQPPAAPSPGELWLPPEAVPSLPTCFSLLLSISEIQFFS